MKKLINIVISPYLLALIISFVIIVFLPPINKYEVNLIKKMVFPMRQEYYHDLDHDLITEHIRLGFEKPPLGFPYVIFFEQKSIDENPKAIYQINLNKPLLTSSEAVFGDYDNNGEDEVYIFTLSNDSLFLTGINPYNSVSVFFERFISMVPIKDGVPDFRLEPAGIFKINNDNYGDFLFNLTAGFSVFPRAIFLYDIHNDELKKTNTQNVYFGRTLKVGYDKVIGPVIFSSTYASENEKQNVNKNYTDSSAWLMAFNKNLELLFDPIEHKGFTSSIDGFPLSIDSNIFLYAMFAGPESLEERFVAKYNLKGDLLGKLPIEKYERLSLSVPEMSVEGIFLQTDNKIVKLDKDLGIDKHFIHCKRPGNKKYFVDIDDDGNKEIIEIDEEYQKMVISRHDFSHPVISEFPFSRSKTLISGIKLSDSPVNLFIKAGDYSLYYQYNKNLYYFFKYPLFILIYLLVLFFFQFIFYQQKKRLQVKFEQEKKMNELELLTIKNQIDPHFTFNAINSLSSMIFDEDKNVAHNFLVSFSDLIRNTLNNSKKISILLKDEVDFVTNYLKLQQTRFENKFDFAISIDKNVDVGMRVPRMIIQTFAENAVKHGLLNKEGKGNISIKIRNESKNLLLKITDDGIGRKESNKFNKKSTGKGHEIIGQIIELYNNIEKTDVSYEIRDLFDEAGKPEGTYVRVKIPNPVNKGIKSPTGRGRG